MSAAAKNDFAPFRQTQDGQWILRFVDSGFSRGKITKILPKMWVKKYGDGPVDYDYHGMKFRLYPFDNTTERKMLFRSEMLDKCEIKLLQSHVSNGGVFVDIGANVGYYSLMAAQGGASRVLALEPNIIVYDRMIQNIALNAIEDIVHPVQMAVGEAQGRLDFYVYDKNLGMSGPHSTDGRKITVKRDTLQSILMQQKITKIDALKIDIEGYEDTALLPYFEVAADENLPGIILIEDNTDRWEQDLFGTMKNRGYKEILRARGNVVFARN